MRGVAIKHMHVQMCGLDMYVVVLMFLCVFHISILIYACMHHLEMNIYNKCFCHVSLHCINARQV